MTIIITGNPRGGTTCVARVVDALGVPMVRDQENSMDWMELRAALMAFQSDRVRSLIEKQTGEWGFKIPGVFGYLPGHLSLFNDPRIIYVVRDPIANADSILRHHKLESVLKDSVKNLAAENWRALNMIPQWGVPFLFVSHEMMLTKTESAVRSIAEFIGREFRPVAMAEVVQSDPRYLPPH